MSLCDKGRLLATVFDKQINIFNIRNNKMFTQLHGYHSNVVYGLETISNGKHLLSICEGNIFLWDLRSI